MIYPFKDAGLPDSICFSFISMLLNWRTFSFTRWTFEQKHNFDGKLTKSLSGNELATPSSPSFSLLMMETFRSSQWRWPKTFYLRGDLGAGRARSIAVHPHPILSQELLQVHVLELEQASVTWQRPLPQQWPQKGWLGVGPKWARAWGSSHPTGTPGVDT